MKTVKLVPHDIYETEALITDKDASDFELLCGEVVGEADLIDFVSTRRGAVGSADDNRHRRYFICSYGQAIDGTLTKLSEQQLAKALWKFRDERPYLSSSLVNITGADATEEDYGKIDWKSKLGEIDDTVKRNVVDMTLEASSLLIKTTDTKLGIAEIADKIKKEGSRRFSIAIDEVRYAVEGSLDRSSFGLTFKRNFFEDLPQICKHELEFGFYRSRGVPEATLDKDVLKDLFLTGRARVIKSEYESGNYIINEQVEPRINTLFIPALTKIKGRVLIPEVRMLLRALGGKGGKRKDEVAEMCVEKYIEIRDNTFNAIAKEMGDKKYIKTSSYNGYDLNPDVPSWFMPVKDLKLEWARNYVYALAMREFVNTRMYGNAILTASHESVIPPKSANDLRGAFGSGYGRRHDWSENLCFVEVS